MSNWFDVDKSGLAKVQAEKEKFFVVQELVSNAFDENIKLCEINFHRIDGTRTYQLMIVLMDFRIYLMRTLCLLSLIKKAMLNKEVDLILEKNLH